MEGCRVTSGRRRWRHPSTGGDSTEPCKRRGGTPRIKTRCVATFELSSPLGKWGLQGVREPKPTHPGAARHPSTGGDSQQSHACGGAARQGSKCVALPLSNCRPPLDKGGLQGGFGGRDLHTVHVARRQLPFVLGFRSRTRTTSRTIFKSHACPGGAPQSMKMAAITCLGKGDIALFAQGTNKVRTRDPPCTPRPPSLGATPPLEGIFGGGSL